MSTIKLFLSFSFEKTLTNLFIVHYNKKEGGLINAISYTLKSY